jgi:hypothetical protein
MKIAFTRLGEKGVRVTIERDDGAVLETSSPRAVDRLPHDLMHYVVERELGLNDGLWGRIASGTIYGNFHVRQPGAKRPASRPRPRAGRSKRKGVLEAEVLVGVFHDIWDGTAEREWGSVKAYLDTIWSPRTRSRVEELDAPTIRRVCEALTRTEKAWSRVPVNGQLRVTWPAPN